MNDIKFDNPFQVFEKALCFGESCINSGNFDKALEILKMLEKQHRGLQKMALYGDNSHSIALARTLCVKATALQRKSKHMEAIHAFEEAEELFQAMNEGRFLGICSGNKASVLLDLNRLDEALSLYEREHQLCEEAGDNESVIRSLINQGFTLLKMNETSRAIVKYHRAQGLAHNSKNLKYLIQSILGQAKAMWTEDRLDDALVTIRQVDTDNIGDNPIVLEVLNIESAILFSKGRWGDALELERRIAPLAKSFGDNSMEALSYGNQGLILTELGDITAARLCFQEQHKICRYHENKERLVWGIKHHIQMLMANELYVEANELAYELEEALIRLDNNSKLLQHIDTHFSILIHLEKYDEALNINQKYISLSEATNNIRARAHALVKRAYLISFHLKDSEEALRIANIALDIANHSKDQKLVGMSEEAIREIKCQ